MFFASDFLAQSRLVSNYKQDSDARNYQEPKKYANVKRLKYIFNKNLIDLIISSLTLIILNGLLDEFKFYQ